MQKVLAHAGIGSRRACEEVILQGRVTINGLIARELGTKVVPGRDRVAVDGQPIHDERLAYIAVNKPKGYVSTNNDPSGRPRVVDLVPDIPQRVYTVGRLDEMSVGLMLLTNDGELANKLAHPKFGVEKVYRAVVAGTPTQEVLQKLVEGVWLAEGKVRAKRVRPIANKGDATVLEMVLAEGKNREVRRMLAKLGHKVMTLTRVAVGPVTLKGLKPGGWRFLTAKEVDLLQKVAAGMPVPTGKFGNDRPLRTPTRGPRAAGNQAGGPPARPRPMSGRPPMHPGARPSGDGDQRPQFVPRGEGTRPRPPFIPEGQEPQRRPYVPQGQQGQRPQGRPPYVPQGNGGQRSRPPMGQSEDGPQGRRPAPEGRPGMGQRPGQRPPGPSGPGRPPGPGSRRPAPTPPPPPAARRPPRDEPPPRRIIGMEVQVPPGLPPSRRPPGPRPRPGGPPRRPPGPIGPPPLRRPRRPNDDE